MSHGTPGVKALALTQPKYASFRHTSYCLHLDEALGALNHRRLTPVRATDTKAIIRSKVLWCTLASSNGHSMHGNVSFVADWSRVTSKLGSKLYYIDQTMGADRCCTRLLLTRSSYEGVLMKVDNVEGAPIIEKMGQSFHVVRCQNKKVCDGPHVVKLAIEADESEAKWLFGISRVLVNDHFFVNLPIDKQCKRKDGRTQRYKHHKCYKYNSLLNALCPFQFRREDVDCKLRDQCSGVVLSDIRDLTVNGEVKHEHSKVKSTQDELSKCGDKQKSPSLQQYYNCLADPKKNLGVENSRSERNAPGICSLGGILPTTGAAASVGDGAGDALRCDQYHRYQPTKEDDAFQQGHFETPVGGNSLTKFATNNASEDMSEMAITGKMMSCVDRSPQTCLAGGHSVIKDTNLVSLNSSSEWLLQSVRSRTIENTNHSEGIEYLNSNHNEIVEPKLEIDLMKIALDEVKHKLLKLEKALTKPSQSSTPDTNIEISNGHFPDVLPKVQMQDVMLKRVGLQRLSVVNQTPHQNVSTNSGQLGSNPATQPGYHEPNRNFNCARLLTDAKDGLSGNYCEQSIASSGVNIGGRDEESSLAQSAAEQTRQRKTNSSLYRSTFSSSAKARTKRESDSMTKKT